MLRLTDLIVNLSGFESVGILLRVKCLTVDDVLNNQLIYLYLLLYDTKRITPQSVK